MGLQGAGFAQSFTRSISDLTRLKLAVDQQEAQEERQKELIKLQQAQIKGQEAERELRLLKLQQEAAMRLEALKQQANLSRIMQGGSTAPAQQSIQPATPEALPTLPEGAIQLPTEEVTAPLAGSTRFSNQIDFYGGMLQKVLQLPQTEQTNQAVDNLQAHINSLRNLRNDALAEETKPRELKLQLRQSIRQEPAFKDAQGAMQAFNIISAGFQGQNNFGDIQMISGFARMMDPNSVVRPSEAATVAAAQPILSRLQILLQRLRTGERLTEKDRQDIMRVTRLTMNEYTKRVKREITGIFGPIADEAGIAFDEIFLTPPILGKGSGKTLSDKQVDSIIQQYVR